MYSERVMDVTSRVWSTDSLEFDSLSHKSNSHILQDMDAKHKKVTGQVHRMADAVGRDHLSGLQFARNVKVWTMLVK